VLKEIAVELGVVLVRLAAEERLHVETVLPGDQPGHGRELVRSNQAHQVGAGFRVLVFDFQPVQHLAQCFP
jgi:hypothetical protein